MDPLEKTIQDWEALDSLAETIHKSEERGSLPSGALAAGDQRIIEDLKARVSAPRGLSSDYAVGAVLGRGGTAVVQLARHHILGRDVAVKRPLKDKPTQAEALRLLQEAWIAGRLQHPNVVPVYDLGLDDEGRPYAVLRRIEGVEWADVMHDEEVFRARIAIEDHTEWNLRVLLQVCHAVHFAHSQGIIHRDIKPANVMIGPFGEVYLADWGLALSVDERYDGRIPVISESPEIAGTPVYMAPEMLAGDGTKLGFHTDIYLLGATLYEILAGRAPHEGDSVPEVIMSITGEDPAPIPGAPPELAAVCSRAMARDPADRFESVEAMRLAIQEYLAKRGALLVLHEAEDRFTELRGLLEGEAEPDPQRVYELFSECRFGFRQALALWEGSEPALDGLPRPSSNWAMDSVARR